MLYFFLFSYYNYNYNIKEKRLKIDFFDNRYFIIAIIFYIINFCSGLVPLDTK